MKGAHQLTRAAKGFKTARETLFLEAAAEIGNSSEVRELVTSSKSALILGEKLGFTTKELGYLKQSGKLETSLQSRLHYLCLPKQESIELLKKHQGIYMPEAKVRELIHSTGIPTFPKPNGIPKNYRIKLSEKGCGMKYVHSTDEGTYVRVMPGISHSLNPGQQKPYVNHRVNGNSVDKYGNFIPNKSAEAHIPLAEFIYRDL